MVEVIVVGSRHPCIRCITMRRYVEEIAKEFSGKVTLKYVRPDAEEAKKLGKVEDGYHISVIENVPHDEEGIIRLNKEIDELRKDEEKNWSLIQKKMEELEEKLKPIKEKAVEKKYLMTPVLAVNGKVKCWGYVPSKEKVKEWIKEELQQNS
uniref:Thioredoxin-like fold domain-containing protein n=1 Tax=candidate division WOR-3 bacterium TaxID=2052148 RepID=A0A7C2K2D6_UNCW3